MERLGYKHGTKPDLRGHNFFKPINWAQLEARQVEPPFKPAVVSGNASGCRLVRDAAVRIT